MSTKANPKLIGAFVLGGIALLIAGLLVFGSTNFFREQPLFVAYFDGSLKGLRIGAAVTFRGVPIGQVTDIKVLFEAANTEASIPVVFELDPSRIVDVGLQSDVADRNELATFIDRGFRAQLELDSLVTGLLSINLNFFPNAPPVQQVDRGAFALPYPEVPTLASDMEMLQANAGQIATELSSALNQLNTVLSTVSSQISSNQGRFSDIVEEVADFTASLSEAKPKLDRLLTESADASAAVGRTATTLDTVLKDSQPEIAATLERLQVNITAVGRMADQINNMVAENREGLRDFSQNGLYEITGLAQDAQRMVDQIARVMDELERDPARFLFGDRMQGIEAQ